MKIIVYLAAFLAIIGIAFAEEDKLDEFARKSHFARNDVVSCLEKTEQTLEQMKDEFRAMFKSKNISNPASTDNKGICFLACLLQKQGSLEDNKLNADKLYKLLDERADFQTYIMNQMETIAKTCTTEANTYTSECEVTYQAMRCIMEKVKEEEEKKEKEKETDK